MVLAAVAAAFCVSLATLALAWAVVTWMSPQGGWFEPTYTGMAAAGSLMGAILYLVVRVVLGELAPSLFRWSLRIPHNVERTWGEALTTTCLALAGSAAAMALVLVIGHAVSPSGLALWPVPVFRGAVPAV